MNFLTAKQVSALWGITPKRVTVLALQGRIPGAKQIDGRWFIPENAVKPGDPRKKAGALSPKRNADYLFPFPLCIVTSEEQTETFTEEQAALYRLNLLFEKGIFPEARELAESLLTSENRYIRIGALYLLPTICMSLMDFSATDAYFVRFRAICLEEEEHKADINTLLIESDGELVNFSEFVRNINNLDVNACSRELLPFLSAYKLLAQVMQYKTTGVRTDVSSYEILCRLLEKQGCFYNMIWVSKAPKNKAICSLKTSYKSANGSFSGLSIVY